MTSRPCESSYESGSRRNRPPRRRWPPTPPSRPGLRPPGPAPACAARSTPAGSRPGGHPRSAGATPMTGAARTVGPIPEMAPPEHPARIEVFSADVQVPAATLLGVRGEGWARAKGSRPHERGMVGIGAAPALEAARARLVDDAPRLL